MQNSREKKEIGVEASEPVMYLLFLLFPVLFFLSFFAFLVFFKDRWIEGEVLHGLRGGVWVRYLFQDKPPMGSQIIDTTRRERSEKEGRRLKSEERQGEEAIESTQQWWWWWWSDGLCLKQSSHVQNNSTNGTRKRQEITKCRKDEKRNIF